ncbi:7-cyano-7-deazaguanine synthase [Mycobacterium europaeum]|uniref:7-cyano-7-deazaguanine synthase n=1 Tax=Mycobacterium europaeum TaxID=761804 RepID=A0A0U1DP57_9MYCO|nr:hypothetical protein [Mycobacterium europaeum]CQD20037.1 7-cyano-7-deazaguanine synthase [Mycobacterium europaeum]
MSEPFMLSVEPVPAEPTAGADRTFFWNGTGSHPWFVSTVGPNLGAFGEVNDRNIDFVRIASAVLSADRSVSRSGRLASWNKRDIAVVVDVLSVDPWDSVRGELQELLGFLTGDTWHLGFREQRGTPEQIAIHAAGASRVVLFSGGGDSGVGALLSAHELHGTAKHTLVSHFSDKYLPPLQRCLAERTDTLYPGTLADHIQVHHSRGRKTVNGNYYRKENSTRSRSLLFLAFGLAVASVDQLPLWIPENGYASINPPLSPNRRGSLSTKTTHPTFLLGVRNILTKVGAHGDLSNPFADRTKGEMFSEVRDLIGEQAASEYLSATTSCSHTGAKTYGISRRAQCGVCFGCLLRKASFISSGIPDRSEYICPKDDARVADWLASKSVESAMRDFLRTDLQESDLATMRLPNTVRLADAAALCNRAMDELRGLAL